MSVRSRTFAPPQASSTRPWVGSAVSVGTPASGAGNGTAPGTGPGTGAGTGSSPGTSGGSSAVAGTSGNGAVSGVGSTGSGALGSGANGTGSVAVAGVGSVGGIGSIAAGAAISAEEDALLRRFLGAVPSNGNAAFSSLSATDTASLLCHRQIRASASLIGLVCSRPTANAASAAK